MRRFGLRTGDDVTGQVRPPKGDENYYGLLRVEAVNGVDPEVAKQRPISRISRRSSRTNCSTSRPIRQHLRRLVNLIAPIGRGQRGLIVSPPKAGKTILLKNIANWIPANYNDVT